MKRKQVVNWFDPDTGMEYRAHWGNRSVPEVRHSLTGEHWRDCYGFKAICRAIDLLNEAEDRDEPHPISQFRLISRTNTFKTTFFFQLGDGTECVAGRDDKNGVATSARIEDVIDLSETAI